MSDEAGTAGDTRTMREWMRAGDDYQADDPEIAADARRRADLQHRINALHPTQDAERRALFTELLGAFGDGADIRPPFYCDLGYQTRIGARSFVNYGPQSADVATITIGENTVVGAGSVVVRDLPANVIAVGNPARVVRTLD